MIRSNDIKIYTGECCSKSLRKAGFTIGSGDDQLLVGKVT